MCDDREQFIKDKEEAREKEGDSLRKTEQTDKWERAKKKLEEARRRDPTMSEAEFNLIYTSAVLGLLEE